MTAYQKATGAHISIVQNEGEQAAKEQEFDKLMSHKKGAENPNSMKTSFVIAPSSDQVNLKSSITE